jgi:hypothetical protein
MIDHAPRYPSYDPGIEPYEERPTSNPVAHYQVGRSARTNYGERSLPLFLSDSDGEPDPSEYMPLQRKRGSYTLSVLLSVSACVTLGLLAALVSSDSAREIIAGAKASTTAVLSAASAAIQPSSAQPRPADAPRPDVPLKETARLPTQEMQPPVSQSVTTSVAVAAVAPSREDIKTAYQSALQGSAPPTAVVPETATPPADAIHHLDAGEITALLQRANALIATGDLAAARLVLRRAAEAGDGHAAMTLGGTYDPSVLEKLGVHGVVPDLGMARSWYEKARRFGAPEAAAQLEVLANRQR